MFLTTKLLVVFALVLPVFGQDKQEKMKDADDRGMSWYYFDNLKKCQVDWDASFGEREKAFITLADRVKGGDKNKITLWINNVRDTQHSVVRAWGCSSTYIPSLERSAGIALVVQGRLGVDGKMTEKEYDEAMSLIKTLKEKMQGRDITSDQKKLWSEAVVAIGEDPESSMYKFDKR